MNLAETWGAWRRRLGRGPTPSASRWIVLDVESSGLDATSDRLLAIAAVALRMSGPRPEVDLADSFDAVLRHDARDAGSEAAREGPDKANILVHGIGVGAMRAGHAPAEVLRRFAHWAGDAPRLGFHVAFDRTIIERAEGRYLGRHPGSALPAFWLDIEPLAAIAHPEVKARALDEWLAHFGIPCLTRHQAIADALASAELLLRLWPRLQHGGPTDAAALARLAASRRWL